MDSNPPSRRVATGAEYRQGLAQVVARSRVILCAGSGGVGKTTVAASLALAGASMGRRTLVVTIDPAKRLAVALGVREMGHQEVLVPGLPVHCGEAESARFTSNGLECTSAGRDGLGGDPDEEGRGHGALYAMMLDQKSAFDEVVDKYSSDPAARARIAESRIYQQIACTLSGAHEYAALAKLDQLDRERRYDLIVVDTPPTAHALDFLEAPARIMEALDSPAVGWFTKPLLATGRFSLLTIGKGSSFVMKRLAKLVGSAFLEDMARFFIESAEVLAGFRERARRVQELLCDRAVSFVVVTVPEPAALDEALLVHRRLVTAGMKVGAMVVNRVHRVAPSAPPVDELVGCLANCPACQSFGRAELDCAAQAMLASHEEIGALASANQQEIARARSATSEKTPFVGIPFLDQDVFTVEQLAKLGAWLLRPGDLSDYVAVAK
ncbi:MAG: ArsA-related P-loop ATPase [Pseudomonadota bacterium]